MQACRPTVTEMQVCSLIPRPFNERPGYEASRCVDQPILEMSLMFPYSSSKNSMSTYSTSEFFLMLYKVKRARKIVTSHSVLYIYI